MIHFFKDIPFKLNENAVNQDPINQRLQTIEEKMDPIKPTALTGEGKLILVNQTFRLLLKAYHELHHMGDCVGLWQVVAMLQPKWS